MGKTKIEKTHNDIGLSMSYQEIFSKCQQTVDSVGAFAFWRLPGEASVWFCAGERSSQSEGQKLEDMPAGFVYCPFAADPSTKVLISETITENVQLDVSDIDRPIPYYKASPAISQLPDFVSLVTKAIAEVKSGTFDKVVMSRYQDLSLSQIFDPLKAFCLLTEQYPSAFVSMVSDPVYGTWIGASPETLIQTTSDGIFKTVALAGTQKDLPAQVLGEVLWSQKEIEEQALVSRYIINCFKKIRLREFQEHGPKTVRAGNLLHLKTLFEVDAQQVGYEYLGQDMLDLLHPTSAVCGMPKAEAMKFVIDHEGYDRSLYSGFLGPVNVDAGTHLFVNLRCMTILENSLRFFAGGGITSDSIPKKELMETKIKTEVLSKVLKNFVQHPS